VKTAVSEAHTANQHGLITRERAEKFDLLGQLILNQREAIILCGAEGIGKTRLLNLIKNARENIWIICLLQGFETLEFEQIQSQLISVIQQRNPDLANQDLEFLLNFCEQQQQKVVLMIDDASELTAGLITTLTEYALHNPVLRLVFAFTREQLYLKNRTDRAVDDCYFMEIPALTTPQMAIFLQDLSMFPNLDRDVQAINDILLSKLYQRTAGIPGKIILELPLLVECERKKIHPPLSGGVWLIISAVLIGIVFFQAYTPNHQADLASLPITSLHFLPLRPVKSPVIQDVIAIAKQSNNIGAAEKFKPPTALKKTTELQTNITQQDADEQWILQQAAGSYTLQLMASSRRQSLIGIVKKYQNLQKSLKVLQIKSQPQEKYVLLYASFADTQTAYSVVNSLPVEFRQAWPRQFNSLQQEVKNRAVSLPKPKQLPLKQ
jgi:DamX protein